MRNLTPPLLLLMMLALIGSGLYRYLFAFSLNATSIHMLAGLVVVIATMIHLVHIRKPLVKHFVKIIKSPIKLAISCLIMGLFIATIVTNIGPARWLMANSYESRKKEAIFRPHQKVTFQTVNQSGGEGGAKGGAKTEVFRDADGINLLISCELNRIDHVVIAIWAESNGDMIEPLYLSPQVAYSSHVTYENSKVARMALLPVFFDGYQRMKDRVVKDNEAFDGVSSATITGSFNLDSLFASNLKQFTLMVEVNQIGDDNNNFNSREAAIIAQTPVGVGVPSLIYQTEIDLYEDTKYYLMAQGGISEYSDDVVSIGYETDGVGLAMELVEKILVKVISKPDKE